MGKVRLSMEVSQSVIDLIDELADRECTTRSDIVRRALAVVKMAKEQFAVGNTHLGFTSDASKLDVEMIGVLTSNGD